MEKIPPRQLILTAVVTCIEKFGLDKLTTRKIAEEAGTNIASINYYFRTKEALVNEALSMSINHMMEDVRLSIGNKQQPFLEAFEEIPCLFCLKFQFIFVKPYPGVIFKDPAEIFGA